jgi:type I restriction enzyme S subunit
MNKIDKLIAEHCPNGVEFKELGEVCESTSNVNWPNNIGKSFKYIDLSSVDRVTHAISEVQTVDSETAPNVHRR